MIKLTEELYKQCEKEFLELGEEGLFMSHYDLAKETFINNPQIWKQFLIDPKIADYIASEMTVIRTATMNKMVNNAADSNSVGQSQLINTLSKLDEKNQTKEGPTFIYTYVPLNEEQKQAPNVRVLETDTIKKVGDNEYVMEID